MKNLTSFMLALMLAAHPVAASDLVFETDAQFEASQKARGEGLAAFRAGEATLALSKMEEALTLRPGNPMILGYVAYLAAETGDLKRAANAARKIAVVGQAPGAGIQKKLSEKLTPDVWAAIKAKFDTNVSSMGKASTHAIVGRGAQLVEGIAMAPDGRTFVSTVVSGGIYKVMNGDSILLVNGRSHGMGSFFGIAFDTLHNSIFATYARVDQTPDLAAGEGTTGVAEFDADSGALKNNWVLDGRTDQHQIADLIIAEGHKIYVSDATGKAVYQIDGKALVKAFDLPNSMSPQGITELDGVLYLADWGRGIWRLDRAARTGQLLGRMAEQYIIGIDGLAVRNGKLIGIQNGSNPHKIIEIALSDDGKSVTEIEILAQSLPGFDEPTLSVSTPSGYYFVAGSQWPKFGKGGEVREGSALNATNILKLP